MNKYTKQPTNTHCKRCKSELTEHKKKFGATFCGSYCQRRMIYENKK